MSFRSASRAAVAIFTANIFSATLAFAQAPSATPAADPTRKNVPAEIVPPKPGETPEGKEVTTPPTPLSPGTKASAVAAETSGSRAIDALTEPELDQVITLIRQRYISPNALTDTAVKRATVLGLIERLGASATLIVPGTAEAPKPSPYRSEILPGNIGYVRLGSFDEANLAALDKSLEEFASKNATALVVDLRGTPQSGDFERAAEVCRRLCPKGKILFTLKRPGDKQAEIFTTKDDAKFRGILTVLTDAATEGSPEVVAGTLRALAGAVVIGQKTRGAAAEFTEFPLGNGRALRLAVAEVLLPGDLSVVPEGVIPDVPVEVSRDEESNILAQELEKGAAAFLKETERSRMNEASLVAGTNPDLDAVQAAQASRGQKAKPAVHDAILQRAVDLVTTISVFQNAGKKK